MSPKRLGIVGARGHVGAELVRLLAGHDGFELAWITSTSEAGRPARDALAHAPRSLVFEAPDPQRLARSGVDAVVLALSNGESEPWVRAFDARAPHVILVDLSTDHRGVAGWVYGQPERHRAEIARTTRIANPGCYATGMALALGPLLPWLDGPVHAFGVSGYSGAGAKPSSKNDPETLRDNLLPYALVGHSHEGEVTRELGRPVRFMPHVAPFFRGITLTLSCTLHSPTTTEQIARAFQAAYANEPLVRVQDEVPLVRDVVHSHEVRIGGVSVAGRDLAFVATLDNLLGGAASQALRNLNLAAGFPERTRLES